MGTLVVVGALLLFAGYVAVSIRVIPLVFGGTVDLREQLRAIASLGPGEVLGQTYRAALILLVGVVVLVVGISSYSHYRAYEAAPVCGSAQRPDCRALVQLQVSGVETQSTKSGRDTVVHFAKDYGPATFPATDLPPEAISPGETVTAEVWGGDVTALKIGGSTHLSFATQSGSWAPIVIGGGMVLLGLTWVLIDIALESIGAAALAARDVFVSPVRRRRALYVLLPLFGALLVFFGLAYASIWLGSTATANTLAAIYLIGSIFVLPAIVIVFVAWALRVYMNVRALGMESQHSGWFVLAALLLPPLSLYMPYRLMREVVDRIKAPISAGMLKNWWACVVGWIGLTAAGLTFGSPDPTDSSLGNQFSDGLLIGSVVVGLFGVFFTIRLVRAIDSAELHVWAPTTYRG